MDDAVVDEGQFSQRLVRILQLRGGCTALAVEQPVVADPQHTRYQRHDLVQGLVEKSFDGQIVGWIVEDTGGIDGVAVVAGNSFSRNATLRSCPIAVFDHIEGVIEIQQYTRLLLQ